MSSDEPGPDHKAERTGSVSDALALQAAWSLVLEVQTGTKDTLRSARAILDDPESGPRTFGRANVAIEQLIGELERAIRMARGVDPAATANYGDAVVTPNAVIASSHYEEGNVYFGMRRWTSAVNAYEQSYAESSHPEALLQTALCKWLDRKRARFITNPREWMTRPLGALVRVYNPATYVRLVRQQRWRDRQWWLGTLLFQFFTYEGDYAPEEAIETFRRVIGLHPGTEEAIEARKCLARLLGE